MEWKTIPDLLNILKRFTALRKLHHAIYETIVEIRTQVKVGNLSNEECADLAYILRAMSKLADDIRKECTALQTTAEQVACLRWVQENISDPKESNVIHGDLSVGSPDVKQITSLPKMKTHPKEYKALLHYLKIPIDVSNQDLIRVHWPSFTEHISDLAALGKPLPPGIDPSKTYSQYKLRLRIKKGAPTLDSLAQALEEDIKNQLERTIIQLRIFAGG